MESFKDWPEYEQAKAILRRTGMEEEKLDAYMYDIHVIVEMALDMYFDEQAEKHREENAAQIALEQTKADAAIRRSLNAARKKRESLS